MCVNVKRIETTATEKFEIQKIKKKTMNKEILLKLCSGLPLDPLPPNNKRNPAIAHAAKRVINLNSIERKVKYFLVFIFYKWPLIIGLFKFINYVLKYLVYFFFKLFLKKS